MFSALKAKRQHQQNVIKLVGAKNAQILFDAIKQHIPIMIYEENTRESIDGPLYRSLKALGAEKVYNHYLYMEKEKRIKGAFCTFFHEG